MEIRVFSFDFHMNFTFKIDLIVWKYRKTTNKTRSSKGFKIDLIVWKFL